MTTMSTGEYNAYIASVMKEGVLQSHIEHLAELLDYLHYHTHDSRRSDKGFPDLVLVKGGRLIIAELKRQKGRESAEQKAWAARLYEVQAATYMAAPLGVEFYLWRPSDWIDGTIERILRGVTS